MRLRVKELRDRLNMTGEELASEVGTRPATISKAENDASTMKLQTLLPIADALGVSMQDLFERPDKDPRLEELEALFNLLTDPEQEYLLSSVRGLIQDRQTAEK